MRLKFLRVQSGMTLEQLAEDSGLTRSYLSKIERGISVPSISSAFKIAAALGLSVEQLFGQSAESEPFTIVRANKGAVGDPQSHLSLIAGMQPEQSMRAFVIRPGQTPKRGRIMSHHDGEEILFILTGEIALQIGKTKEVLYAGDCVHFDSTIPHKLLSVSEKPAAALVVISAKTSS